MRRLLTGWSGSMRHEEPSNIKRLSHKSASEGQKSLSGNLAGNNLQKLAASGGKITGFIDTEAFGHGQFPLPRKCHGGHTKTINGRPESAKQLAQRDPSNKPDSMVVEWVFLTTKQAQPGGRG
jgi:hypothetical protein